MSASFEKDVVQENFYEAFLNDDDEIMFAFSSRKSEPNSPCILYDNGKHAIFYRDEKNTIIMDFLHPDIRPFLTKAKFVYVSEVKNDKVIREYKVSKKQVDKLPLDKNNIEKPKVKIDEKKLKRK